MHTASSVPRQGDAGGQRGGFKDAPSCQMLAAPCQKPPPCLEGWCYRWRAGRELQHDAAGRSAERGQPTQGFGDEHNPSERLWRQGGAGIAPRPGRAQKRSGIGCVISSGQMQLLCSLPFHPPPSLPTSFQGSFPAFKATAKDLRASPAHLPPKTAPDRHQHLHSIKN